MDVEIEPPMWARLEVMFVDVMDLAHKVARMGFAVRDMEYKWIRHDANMQAFEEKMEALVAKMEAFEAKPQCTDANVRAEATEHAEIKKRTERLDEWCKMLDTQTQAVDKKVAALVDAKKSLVLWHAGLLMLHAVLMGMVFAWSRTA
jgi:hypothetical protein